MNNSRISSNLSERFAAMSFLCACMIVFFHATPAPDRGSFNWWFFHLFGREGICCIAVPYFFVCSGYFLARHYGEEGWWGREVLKRVKSLVVPYYIWMAIGIAFGILVEYAKRQYFHVETPDGFLSLPYWEKVLLYLGLHPFRDIGVLWYVRTLFFMVLASPVILIFLRWPLSTVCALSAMHIVVCYLFSRLGIDMYFLFDRFVSVRGLLYFFMGAVVCAGRMNDKLELPPETGVLCLFSGMILIIVRNFLRLSSHDAWGAMVGAISVPFLIVGIWTILKLPRFVKALYSFSFPIFLLHNIFLSVVSMAFMVAGVRNLGFMQIPIAFIRTACAIMGAVTVAFAIRRLCPKISNMVFGGR